MATLIIIVGHFLHKTHKLGKIVEMRKQGIDLSYRRTNGDGNMMFRHKISLLISSPSHITKLPMMYLLARIIS